MELVKKEPITAGSRADAARSRPECGWAGTDRWHKEVPSDWQMDTPSCTSHGPWRASLVVVGAVSFVGLLLFGSENLLSWHFAEQRTNSAHSFKEAFIPFDDINVARADLPVLATSI